MRTKTPVKLPTVAQTLRRVGACERWREWARGREWKPTYEGIMGRTLMGPSDIQLLEVPVGTERLRTYVLYPLLRRKASTRQGRLAAWNKSVVFLETITWRKFRTLLLAKRGTGA